MQMQSPLTTSRLRLRSLAELDATEAYLGWLNDPQVTRYTESRFLRFTLESLREYIRTDNASPNTMLLGIFLPEARHIGNIKLATIDHHHLTAEIGIMIGERDTWGEGYATEAIEAISRHAFESLNLEKLFAKCYAANHGSYRAFVRAGFVSEGRLRSQVFSAGERMDLLLVGLTRADWMARRQ
jgi:RimJ/RimL family protein N-acetyltransferase